MNHMSKHKYQSINSFIHYQVKCYSNQLDENECMQEGWRTYLEAERNYHKVEGCCEFTTYAEHSIYETLNMMRRRRNQRIQLESPLSLDTQCENSNETVGQRFLAKSQDCSNYVALWDFIQRQSKEKRQILWQLYNGMKDKEIIEQNGITPEIYYSLLGEIQEAFLEWLKI